MTLNITLAQSGVIELQRHAGDDQQQETRHDEEMQEALERHEAREPFVVLLGFDFGFAERFRVVQVEIDHARSQTMVCRPKKVNTPISRPVIARKTAWSSG